MMLINYLQIDASLCQFDCVVHVCDSICVLLSLCMSLCVSLCVSLYVFVYFCVCVSACVCVHESVCVCAFKCDCLFVCTSKSIVCMCILVNLYASAGGVRDCEHIF